MAKNKGCCLTVAEKNQIEYLEKRKDRLIWQLMDACEEINNQIKDVRNGAWLKCHQTDGMEQEH